MDGLKKDDGKWIDLTEQLKQRYAGPDILVNEGRPPTREEALKLGLTPDAPPDDDDKKK